MAGYLFAGPEKLPFGLPGDLPQGFGALAGVPRAGRSVTKLRKILTGVSFGRGSGFSHGSRRSATTAGKSPAPLRARLSTFSTTGPLCHDSDGDATPACSR